MIPVILETPFAAPDDDGIAANVDFARACMRDCLLRGEAPFASHLLYTQPGVLDDRTPDERKRGIDAGFAWRSVARKTVVYTDRGISGGMKLGVANAEAAGHVIEYRRLVDVGAKLGGDRAP